MTEKKDTFTTKLIIAAVITAAATSLGTEFAKTWLPSIASYIWGIATNSEVIFINVVRDERQNPVSKAVVTATHPDPEQKITFDETLTDEDGRAVLDNVESRDFYLKIIYTEGGKVHTYRRMFSVDRFPYTINITGSNGWVTQDIETSAAIPSSSRPSARGDSSTLSGTDAPRWLEIALQEIGVKELPQGNPRIEEYHASTPFKGAKQDIPWSCSFVSWVLEQAKVQGNVSSARCVDYLRFGSEVTEPKLGAITILRREGIPEAFTGVTGFLVRADSETVTLVVGNVDNQVTIANFPRSLVRGFRWPKEG